MPNRQFTVPMLLQDGQARPLTSLPDDDRSVDEDRLQKLLFDHPELLPVQEIEPLYDELIPMARELPTPAGPLDLLYMTPQGYLALVETKLWRNPEARRTVVAQIIDYATKVAQWSYTDLENAVRKVRPDLSDDPLVELVRGRAEDFDESTFHDNVERNLRLGRHLLLIVGDGIREGVEHMAGYLQQTTQLGFTLGLIEIGLYRVDPEQEEPLFIQPRIVARTQVVKRTVVEITNRAGEIVDVRIDLPREPTGIVEPRPTITEQEFLERLQQNTTREVAEFAREIIEKANKQWRLNVDWGKEKGGFSLKYDNKFSLGSFQQSGKAWFFAIPRQCEQAGINREIGDRYLREVAGLMSGGKVVEDNVCVNELSTAQIELLMPQKNKWYQIIERAVQALQKALENRNS